MFVLLLLILSSFFLTRAGPLVILAVFVFGTCSSVTLIILQRGNLARQVSLTLLQALELYSFLLLLCETELLILLASAL